MKTRLSVIFISLWIATAFNSQACLNCIRLAQQGLARESLDGLNCDSLPAHVDGPANPVDTNADAAVPNSTVALSRTNQISKSGISFTNGAVIGFGLLAGYDINITAELEMSTNGAVANAKINALIPDRIKALDQREVKVDGFMIPSQMENGKVQEFLLSRNPPALCYGSIPQIHEWVKVRVKPPGVEWGQSNIVRARGVLRIGAERLDGTLTSIYRMLAGKVEIMPEH